MEYNYRLRLQDWRFIVEETFQMDSKAAQPIRNKIREYDTPLDTDEMRERLENDNVFNEEVTELALKQIDTHNNQPMHGMYPKTIPLTAGEYHYLIRHLRTVENKNIITRLLNWKRVKQAKRVRRALDNQFYALSVNNTNNVEE